MARYTPDQLAAAVDNWNKNNPPGTPVLRFPMMNPRSGDSTPTKTRSLAWIMGDHSPMVMVEGFTGGMHLDQIEVIPEHRREKSAIPPVESLPPAAPPKRGAAFFLSDVMDTVNQVWQDANAHNDPRHYIRTVITELQRPPTSDHA